jgi:hypothetical protein
MKMPSGQRQEVSFLVPPSEDGVDSDTVLSTRVIPFQYPWTTGLTLMADRLVGHFLPIPLYGDSSELVLAVSRSSRQEVTILMI